MSRSNQPVEHLYTVNEHNEVIPVIRYEDDDETIHTDEHPHCSDNTCPCNAASSNQPAPAEEAGT